MEAKIVITLEDGVVKLARHGSARTQIKLLAQVLAETALEAKKEEFNHGYVIKDLCSYLESIYLCCISGEQVVSLSDIEEKMLLAELDF